MILSVGQTSYIACVTLEFKQLLLDSSSLHWPSVPSFVACSSVHPLQAPVTLPLVIGASVDAKSTNRQFSINSSKASRGLAAGGHLNGFLTEITRSGDNVVESEHE